MSLFHLIAPSGYCIKQHAALRGIQRLTDAGHQVNNVEVIARRCERFAGTETERLEDLNSLARLTTPNTIVLAVRGGYGDYHGTAAGRSRSSGRGCYGG